MPIAPDDSCPFCRQLTNLRELSEDNLVWQFSHSVVLLGTWQYYLGYCLLVCRQHASELSGLTESVRRGFLDEMCLLARAIELAFQPRKLNYELLGNQVPHLHWHLFPRYSNDQAVLRPVWLAVDRAEHDSTLRQRLETGRIPRGETAEILRRRIQELLSS
jgi:diadenosine tetraphosphate (Ap4A) HIT family hydrolase